MEVRLSARECGGAGKRRPTEGTTGGGKKREKPGGEEGKSRKKKKKTLAGRMSERVASCGSLYDSTSLLLQYCNNGELLPSIQHITTQTDTIHGHLLSQRVRG